LANFVAAEKHAKPPAPDGNREHSLAKQNKKTPLMERKAFDSK
jgi:hypothetical protein